MATLTITATRIGHWTSYVPNATFNQGDDYHILHLLGATPQIYDFVFRSVTNQSIPAILVLTTYDMTMAVMDVVGTADSNIGSWDGFFRVLTPVEQ